jgi:NADPH2:quinone reductase
LCGCASGGYAEYSAPPAEKVVKIPDGIKDEDALGVFLMGMTAMSPMEESHKVERGQWVLCHTAAGGVGQLMCQILRKHRGAHDRHGRQAGKVRAS